MKQCAIFVFLCLAIVSCKCNTQNKVINIEKLTFIGNTSDYGCNLNNTTDTQYVVLPEKAVSWFRAVQLCEENGMELATVSNAADNERLRLVLEKDLPSGYAWTSGVKSGCNYIWMKSNSDVSFTNFAANYPTENETALCLSIGRNALWYNYFCHTKYYPACQRGAIKGVHKYKPAFNNCND